MSLATDANDMSLATDANDLLVNSGAPLGAAAGCIADRDANHVQTV